MAINAARNDLASGGIFVAFGAYFVLEAMTYEFGTPLRMGPGFMPVVLGAILVLLGIAVIFKAFARPEEEARRPVPWRGIVLVLGTIVFFAATIRGLGFIPVVLVTAFASAMASRNNRWLSAAIIAAGLCVLCLAVFVVGLGLIVPLVGPWLRF
ncbi:tripartite tricarboxylate transporter TctB family protein [Devosia nitrariae]|uniref:Membrane protein n=1 Tax=Devosia nitrariae TaxID=2071872 RepID=A0ABQ5W3K3_9HYPH|nr:tripartite tricarboxylate transporter TctB family protein [Devosia nitrariae]GLQ54271.1 membrane protein [Devosia nitrariae]